MKHARKKLVIPPATTSRSGGLPLDTESNGDDYHLRLRSPRDLMWILRRHASKTIGSFLAVAGLAILAFLFLPVAYRSDAKVLMRMGRESLSGDPTVTQTPTVIHTRKSEMNTELEILKSRDLQLELIDAIGAQVFVKEQLDSEEQLLKKALKKVENKLGVVSEIDSNIITVSYTHPDREQAQRILQKLMELYIDKHVRAYGTDGSVAFFQQQASDLETRIAELRTQLRRRMDTLGVTSLEAHKLSLTELRAKVLLDIQANSTELNASRARSKLLGEAIKTQERIVYAGESLGTPNPLTEWLKVHISQLKLQKKQLEADHHPNHELVLEVQAQMDLASEMLKGQADDKPVVTRSINTTRQALELQEIQENANLAGLTAQRDVLQQQQTSLEKDFTALQAQEGPVLALRDELATLEL
ncbi:MAG: GumC family protein, partial [Planctomycetota bacterium]